MESSKQRKLRDTDTTSTRVIKHQSIDVDGAPFTWWAVGDEPVLVTVRSNVFGTAAKFTYGEPAKFAYAMAKTILEDHYRRAQKMREGEKRSGKSVPVLEMPGWLGIAPGNG